MKIENRGTRKPVVYQMIQLFMDNKQRAVSIDEATTTILGYNSRRARDLVRSWVSYARRKLEAMDYMLIPLYENGNQRDIVAYKIATTDDTEDSIYEIRKRVTKCKNAVIRVSRLVKIAHDKKLVPAAELKQLEWRT